MKHKFLTHFVCFWTVLSKSDGISTFDIDTSSPFWNSYQPCAIHLPLNSQNPNFLLCDPDEILSNDEIANLRHHMKPCSDKIASLANDTKVIIFAFNNINIQVSDNQTLSNIDLLLGYLTSRWINFLNDPIYLVIAVKERNEVREWHSAIIEYQHQPGQSFLEQFGSPKENFHNTLTVIQDVICNVIEYGLAPVDFSLSSILWIILSTVIITGSITFGCWIYRFNKSHPTTEEADLYEMTQDVFYDEDGNPLPTGTSGFVLTQDEIEAASPDPAKTTTHEALDRI